MDQESQDVAGRFVDELKNLGVLLPATKEVITNVPPYEREAKQCIADGISGRQNACIGKTMCTWCRAMIFSPTCTREVIQQWRMLLNISTTFQSIQKTATILDVSI
jgi:hypothetical protein